MNKILLFIICLSSLGYAQQHTDYVGAGNNNNIVVYTSSNHTREDWNEQATGEKTVDGSGLNGRLLETSRFLAQATFGTKQDYIQSVSEGSFNDWIDRQLLINSPSLATSVTAIENEAKELFIANGGNANDYTIPSWVHFQYAWWNANLGNEDLLRQRVALALSEIFVVSINSNLANYGVGLGSYYDVLKDNAFGNFKNLLKEVSLHPMMGSYLSHYNNPRSFPYLNAHPDENYAREIMQLFSVGLYELNQDGTYVLDNEGNRIPTYDNNDIKEFAKIFTGLGAAEVVPNNAGETARFGTLFKYAKKDVPLTMYDNWHQPGEKKLLNGFVVPSGQTGMQDIDDAITNLFNHPNTGPFIAVRLIQQLVKSNPSPNYVKRVADAFNNTNGVRGSMKAVIKAILLDPEARQCYAIQSPSHGKLIEPMQRYFNVARQLDLTESHEYKWNAGVLFYNATGQAPLASPSVFNFFTPFYTPNVAFAEANLVAPEFNIHDSASSILYVNEVNHWTNNTFFPVLQTLSLGLETVKLDYNNLKYYAKDAEVLINQLDVLFTRGMLSQHTKNTITNAINSFPETRLNYLNDRVQIAIYLLLVSPDYTILK